MCMPIIEPFPNHPAYCLDKFRSSRPLLESILSKSDNYFWSIDASVAQRHVAYHIHEYLRFTYVCI